MLQFPFRWPSMSDDEYIMAVRKSLRIWDRWWLYLSLLSGCCLVLSCVVIAMLPAALNRIAQLQLGANGNAAFVFLGFLSGAALGTCVSMVLHGMVHNLTSFISGLHGQRLLIACYDSLNSACGDHVQQQAPTTQEAGDQYGLK
ncbi:MAG: hypothetical protein JWN70_6045 [Planctomycetaceae bacterium]|nr:hypothetical protein [Planctomycetaceae bacterium]